MTMKQKRRSKPCRSTAAIAPGLAQLRAGPDLGHTAYLAGLLHDMGKYTEEYRAYIEAAAAKQKVRRGSVNHTYAGVRFILERWHRQPFLKRLTCELLAVAVGSHHGLFDIFSKDGADGFLKRLQKEGIHYDEAKAAFLEQCAEEQELDALFCRAFQEVDAVVQKFYDTFKNLKEEEMHFYVSLLARFLMSAVMDGDRRDTAGFMCGAETPGFRYGPGGFVGSLPGPCGAIFVPYGWRPEDQSGPAGYLRPVPASGGPAGGNLPAFSAYGQRKNADFPALCIGSGARRQEADFVCDSPAVRVGAKCGSHSGSSGR